MKRNNTEFRIYIPNIINTNDFKKIVKECYYLYQLQYLLDKKLIDETIFNKIKNTIT